jgi:hypothetical protein
MLTTCASISKHTESVGIQTVLNHAELHSSGVNLHATTDAPDLQFI